MRLGTIVILMAVFTAIAFYPTELIWVVGKFIAGAIIIFNYVIWAV